MRTVRLGKPWARETVAKGGRILFVGTKRQAQKPVADAAERCAQYYMNHRWLGGTLTNWKTVSNSISRLKEIDALMGAGVEGLTKKERLGMERDQIKLQASLGGISEMGGLPDLMFVIDVNKESIAIAEGRKLGIPVVAVVDTNCPPDGVDYIIPGNDDAARAIALYCDLISRAALDGMSAQLQTAGVDLGSLEEGTLEEALADESAVERQSARPLRRSVVVVRRSVRTLCVTRFTPAPVAGRQPRRIQDGGAFLEYLAHLAVAFGRFEEAARPAQNLCRAGIGVGLGIGVGFRPTLVRRGGSVQLPTEPAIGV